VDGKIRTIHAAEITSAAFFLIDYMGWMVSLGVEGRRKRQHLGWTELNTEATSLTSLNNN
jgi:hypothetical protein